MIIAFQKECDKYKVILTRRFHQQNSRQAIETSVLANQLENLHLTFNKTMTERNTLYDNFRYSVDKEILLMSYGATVELLERINGQICRKNPNCIRTDSNGKCLKCRAPLVVFNGNCVDKCPDGYSKNATLCAPCPIQCKTCNGPKDCLSCKDKNLLNEKSCVPSCPNNRAPLNGNCVKCDENDKCLICKDPKTCTQCTPDKILYDGKCLDKCPVSTFPTTSPRECKPCPINCLTCDSTQCLVCTNNTFLKDGNCVPSCGKSSYNTTNPNTCKPCTKGCLECDNPNTCKVCDSTLVLNDQKKCVNSCEKGQVNINGACTPCGDKVNCKTCDGKDINTCRECANKLFLKNGKCVNACGDGFYVDVNNNCVPCATTNCKTCTKDKCLQCVDNKVVFEDKTCMNFCPDGNVRSGNNCVKCTNPNCKSCLVNDLQICDVCYPPKAILNGVCYTTCPLNFYQNGNKCSPCFKGCEQCVDGTTCKVCDKDHFKKNGACVECCDSGWTEDGKECKKCIVNDCDVCNPNTLRKCEKCKDGKKLYNNECNAECPTGTFADPSGICVPCKNYCDKCTKKDDCLICKAPMVLQGNNCQRQCDESNLANTDRECKPCKNPRCKNCNIDKCIECRVGNVLINGDCQKPPCPDGTFNKQGVCTPCVKPCKSCSSESTCTDCIQGFALFNGKCTDQCPDFTTMVNGKCENCTDKNCQKCANGNVNTCIMCCLDTALFNSKCLKVCPDGNFDLNGICTSCGKDCEKCVNASECVKCRAPKLLQNKQCVDKCSPKWVAVKVDECAPCSLNCKSCAPNDATSCTDCDEPNKLYGKRCVPNCPAGTYTSDNRVCLPCKDNLCEVCNKLNTCSKCISPNLLQNGVCVPPPCKSGFTQTDPFNCLACEVNKCKKCPGSDLKKCDECKTPWLLTNNNQCIDKCRDGFYEDKDSKKCLPCKKNCDKCDNNTTCSLCSLNYFLLNGNCSPTCPSGYSKGDRVCDECKVKQCDTCSCPETCDVCVKPLVLFKNTCVQECPVKMYNLNGQCVDCPYGCLDCCDSKSCDKCDVSKTLVNGVCEDICLAGSIKLNGKCVTCQAGPKCLKCNEKNLEECVKCEAPLVIKNGKCVDKCDEGWVNVSGTCKPCTTPNCKTCVTPTECTFCKRDFYFFNKECLSKCPDGTFENAGKCPPCSDRCAKCDPKGCINCAAGFYLLDKRCVPVCPSGTYRYGSACLPCGKDCMLCSTKDTCVACIPGKFILNDGTCGDCPKGTVEADRSKCVPCGQDCETCNKVNPKECIKCIAPNKLINGVCKKVCDVKYFNDNGVCEPCLDGCNTCKDCSTCDKCDNKLFLSVNKDKCVPICPDGTTGINGQCVPCKLNQCKKCNTNVEECDECHKPLTVFDCKCDKCPSVGFFVTGDGLRCEPCKAPCLICTYETCKKCDTGFNLIDGKCVIIPNCQAGTFLVNGKCLPCKDPNCKSCDKNLECVECKPNFIKQVDANNKTTCVECCDKGFFNNNGTCDKCGPNCDDCANQKQCTVCADGFLLENGKCVKVCSRGMVANPPVCKPCEVSNDPNNLCITCDPLTRKECKTCDSNYFLKNGVCVPDCGPNYYPVVAAPYKECKPCTTNCPVCNNSEKCLDCRPRFNKNGLCVEECGKGFVPKDDKTCTQCLPQNCKKCDRNNGATCIHCEVGYYVKDRQCVKDCGKGYSLTNGVCEPCVDPKCINCKANKNICDVCQIPFKSNGGKCVPECLCGQAEINNKCIDCDTKNCDECSPAKLNDCILCSVGFYLTTDKKCVPKCLDGTYAYQDKCLPCHADCVTCGDAKTCIVCKPPKVIKSDKTCDKDPNTCIGDECKKCPDGQIRVDGVCKPCKNAPNCTKCLPDLTTCTDCKKNLILYNKDCHPTCPVGTYPLGTTCHECSKYCDQCKDLNSCKRCTSPYVLQDGKCVNKCNDGFYLDTNTRECKKCDNFDLVKSCKPIDVCRDNVYKLNGTCVKRCPDGTSSDSLNNCVPNKCLKILFKGECIDTCPIGTVRVDGTCKYCDSRDCNACRPQNLAYCECCNEKLLLYKGECKTACPAGTYMKEGECIDCKIPCKECKNEASCTKCVQPFLLRGDTCVSQCPAGEVMVNGVCLSCRSKDCEICTASDLNKCEKCKGKMFIFNDLCVEKCPEKYTYDPVSLRCKPCPKLCDICNTKGECIKCSNGFYKSPADSTQCVPCDNKRQVVVGDTCKLCKVDNCLKCECDTQDKCEICEVNKIKNEVTGRCDDNCQNRFFKTSDNKCLPCQQNCAVCLNADNCITCDKPLIAFNGKCLPTCPSGYVMTNNQCVPCANKDCNKCGENTKDCFDCKFPSILLNKNCVRDCPDGTFRKGNECVPCKNCPLCNENGCIKCTPPLKLQGTECVKVCNSGFLDNGAKCVPCGVDKCDKCDKVKECKQCINPEFLNSAGNCVSKCAPGTYEALNPKRCLDCDIGCRVCNGPKQCTECEKGLFLFNGTCVKKCPSSFAPGPGICEPCKDTQCQKCHQDKIYCDECKPPSLLLNRACVPKCPNGFFALRNKCVECGDTKCNICKGYKDCVECKPEFTIKNGVCINTNCPDNKVLVNDKCIPCEEKTCKTCLTNTKTCVECIKPYLLSDKTCRTSCENGFFADANGVCQPCGVGCNSCKSKSPCNECKSGWFLFKGECTKQCPQGYFGECKDNICKNCHNACKVCTSGSSGDCSACTSGFFLDGTSCVLKENCRRGTFGDVKTGKCATCNVQYCLSCADCDTCSKCIPGFEVNSKGLCVESKGYYNVIPPMPQLLSQNTLNIASRVPEIVNFNSKLNGVGIGSSVVTFTFFIRRVTEYFIDTTVFKTVSDVASKTVRFYIRSDSCFVEISNESHRVGDCSYNHLYNWKFFAVTLEKVVGGSTGTATVVTGSPASESSLQGSETKITFDIPQNLNFLNKNSNIEFNEVFKGNAFELSQFNVMDYNLNRKDTLQYINDVPKDCDYSCVVCTKKCQKCPGDAQPSSDGTCSPVFVPVLNDLQVISSRPPVQLRSLVTKRLDSFKYAFSSWFHSLKPLDSSFVIGNLYYNYQPETPILSLRVIRNRVVVDANNHLYLNDTCPEIEPNKWYHVGVTVNNSTLRVWIQERNGQLHSSSFRLNNRIRLLTEDAFFSTLGRTPADNFNGTQFDGRLYINNIPSEPERKDQYDNLRCSKDCLECNQAMRCIKCPVGFKLDTNYKCINDNLGAPIRGLDKYSFFNSDTYSINVPSNFNGNKPFTISFWYRKKIHSVPDQKPQDFFRVLSIVPQGKENELIPIVTEKLQPSYQSNFTLTGDCGPKHNFIENFSDEVYSWIHFVITFNIPKESATFIVQNDNKVNFVGNMTYNISKFVFGDRNGNDLNFEIGNVFFYPVEASPSNLPLIRETKPKDCDPGCTKCNYFTGQCQECKIRKPGLQWLCPKILIGYASAYTHNVETFDPARGKLFTTGLRESFTRDVNSLEYSVIGYFRIFDLETLKKNPNAKLTVFTVANRVDGKISPSNNLISLQVRLDQGAPVLEWKLNDHDNLRNTIITGCDVVPDSWVFIYGTINVVKKRFDFAIRHELPGEQTKVGAILFDHYPEKLQEKGTFNVFGVGQNLTPEYKVPNAHVYYLYVSPNLGWNPKMVDKYRASFPIKKDPKCIDNCTKCIHDVTRKIDVCLICAKNYSVKNDVCVKNSQSEYVIISDQYNTNFLPPTTDFTVPKNVITLDRNTLNFYIRRNWIPREVNDNRVILRANSLTVSLQITQGSTASLNFVINGESQNIAFTVIDPDLDEDYTWYLVTLHYSSRSIRVQIKCEKEQIIGDKTINLNNNFDLSSLSFNSLNQEVSIYGPHLMFNNFYDKPLFGFPISFCGVDCNACVNNKCIDCQYGKDAQGRCLNRPIKIPAFNVQNNSNLGERFPISQFIGLNKPLRSSTWSTSFTFESQTDIINLTGTLLRIQNSGSTQYNANLINDNIFSIKFHSDRSFFITINQPYFQNKLKSSFGWTSRSLKVPANKNYFVGISIDCDLDQVHLFVYNAPDNFIKQSFHVQGALDNLNNQGTLVFGEGLSQPIIVDYTRFYYNSFLKPEVYEGIVNKHFQPYQNVCKSSSRLECYECKNGLLESSGDSVKYCSPVPKTYSYLINHVKQLDENQQNHAIPALISNANEVNSFTFSLWYRRSTYNNDAHGILRLANGNNSVTTVNYENNDLIINAHGANNSVVNSARIVGLYDKHDALDWLYISVSINAPNGSISVFVHNSRSNRNSFVSKAGSVAVPHDLCTLSLTFSLDITNCPEDLYIFDISTFIFTPNYIPVNSDSVASYRIRKPFNCESHCTTQCLCDLTCPINNRITREISLFDVYANHPATQGLTDPKTIASLPLFRNTTSYFGVDPSSSPLYKTYLIGFEVNVPQILSSTYTSNKNMLININDNPENCNLKLSDVICDNDIKYGLLSVELRNNAIRFYAGSSKANNYVSFYDFNYESNNFKGISKLQIELLFNTNKNDITVMLYIDDIRTSFHITTIYHSIPITRDTVVYSHPAVKDVRINVHNPRFNFDFYSNIFPKSYTSVYSSSQCKSRRSCEKCTAVSGSTKLMCDRCAKGYKMVHNFCFKENSWTK